MTTKNLNVISLDSQTIKYNKNINDNKFDKIKLHDIIVTHGTHATVWHCSYKKKDCVLKMVLLSEGGFNNKNNFKKKNDGKDPFRHSTFKHRKPMLRDKFLEETVKLKDLSALGLAPKVYDWWIDDTSFNVHYGFILMTKMDSDLKHILYERNLTPTETNLVENFINTLHNKHGIVHHDLKPANMGVILNVNKEIEKIVALDCSRVKYKRDFSIGRFKRLCKRDWDDYNKYKQKNIEQGLLMRKNKRI